MLALRYCGRALHDSLDAICHDIKLSLSANSAGSLTFVVPPENPLFDELEVVGASREIVCLEGTEELFRGRITDIEEGDECELSVSAEGQLAYLNDALVRPFVCVHTDDTPAGTAVVGTAPRGVVLYLLAQHNTYASAEEHMELGTCDVSGTLDIDEDSYPTVGECLKDSVLDALGAYARVRFEDGVRYLDVLATGGSKNGQLIEFGKNLLSYTRETDSSDVITAIVPSFEIGDEKDLSLNDVLANASYEGMQVDGTRIINSAAAGIYGVCEEKRSYKASSRDAAATALINDAKTLSESFDSLSISAVDLSLLDKTVQPIRLYDWVEVLATPYKVDRWMMCTELTLSDDPKDATYTFGTVLPTLTRAAVRGIPTQSGAGGIRGADGKDAILINIESTNGVAFKNSEVNTSLRVSIFYGSQVITDTYGLRANFGAGAYLEWKMKALGTNEAVILTTDDTRLSEGGFSLTIAPEDIDTQCVFTCELYY